MNRMIRLVYRKIIDIHSAGDWEKFVFEDTYTEFRMQSQFYNQEKKYTSFRDMITYIPEAKKIPFLVSTAATSYLRQLNGIMPDIKNGTGKKSLCFVNYDFEILSSDTHTKSEHRVAILFYSELLNWQDTIGNQVLVSAVKQDADSDTTGTEIKTDLYLLQPPLSIYSLQTDTNEPGKS